MGLNTTWLWSKTYRFCPDISLATARYTRCTVCRPYKENFRHHCIYIQPTGSAYLLQKLFGVFFLNCDFCKSATDSTRSPTAMVARPAWVTPT